MIRYHLRFCQYARYNSFYAALTYRRNNLRLKPSLVLKSSDEVADLAFAISSYIRRVANVVVHVARSEQQDQDE